MDRRGLEAFPVVPYIFIRLIDIKAANAYVTANFLAKNLRYRGHITFIEGNSIDHSIHVQAAYLFLECFSVFSITKYLFGSCGECDVALPSMIADHFMASIREFLDKIGTTTPRASDNQNFHSYSCSKPTDLVSKRLLVDDVVTTSNRSSTEILSVAFIRFLTSASTVNRRIHKTFCEQMLRRVLCILRSCSG